MMPNHQTSGNLHQPSCPVPAAAHYSVLREIKCLSIICKKKKERFYYTVLKKYYHRIHNVPSTHHHWNALIFPNKNTSSMEATPPW